MRGTMIAMVFGVWCLVAGQSSAGGAKAIVGPPGYGHRDGTGIRAVRDWLCFRSMRRTSPNYPAACCRPPVYAYFHNCNHCGDACRDNQAICIGFNYTSLIDCRIEGKNGDCASCK